MPEVLADSTRLFSDIEGQMDASPVEPVFYPLPGTSGVAPVYGQTNEYVDNTSGFRVVMVATLERTPSKPDPSTVDKPHSEKLPRLWQRAADRFKDRILQDLDDDCSDADASTPVTLCDQARSACLDLASELAATMAFQPGLKYAAFVEEEGGVSLVIQSTLSARRANFRISPDGLRITVVSVNTMGRAESTPVQVQDSAKLRRWVEWASKEE